MHPWRTCFYRLHVCNLHTGIFACILDNVIINFSHRYFIYKYRKTKDNFYNVVEIVFCLPVFVNKRSVKKIDDYVIEYACKDANSSSPANESLPYLMNPSSGREGIHAHQPMSHRSLRMFRFFHFSHRQECPEITYMAMGFRPHSFPVGGMYLKGTGQLTKV